jgi:hypothetical protein
VIDCVIALARRPLCCGAPTPQDGTLFVDYIISGDRMLPREVNWQVTKSSLCQNFQKLSLS